MYWPFNVFKRRIKVESRKHWWERQCQYNDYYLLESWFVENYYFVFWNMWEYNMKRKNIFKNWFGFIIKNKKIIIIIS